MSQLTLKQEILSLSDADFWEAAHLEWHLESVDYADEPETCLCEHYPILELCHLRNRRNGNEVTVGSHCVKRFMGLPSGRIFSALTRVASDPTRSLNAAAIEHFGDRGWLTDWEVGFYLDVGRKQNLSIKQARKKEQINRLILTRMGRKPMETQP